MTTVGATTLATRPRHRHRLTVGQRAPQLTAMSLAGATVAIPDPEALVHLQFRRFAGCPVCNLHLRGFAARVDELRNSVIPLGIEATITRDYGATAAEKANKLISKLAFATGSVILLVGLALGRREAVIVGAAVILTLTATLFASWAWGFTLNRVSLFALIFSIGILVDDAIVVVENIHRHQQLEPGKPLAEIIPAAVDEVGGPTILATLTVIAALLPMAFVSGLMGPYMSPIPINSSLGMALSLAIAFTVTPWLALKLMKSHGAGHAAAAPAAPSKLQRLFERVLLVVLVAEAQVFESVLRTPREGHRAAGRAVRSSVELGSVLPRRERLDELERVLSETHGGHRVAFDGGGGVHVAGTGVLLQRRNPCQINCGALNALPQRRDPLHLIEQSRADGETGNVGHAQRLAKRQV